MLRILPRITPLVIEHPNSILSLLSCLIPNLFTVTFKEMYTYYRISASIRGGTSEGQLCIQ